MNPIVMQAPVSLLLNQDLTASAKLVWMLSHGGTAAATLLANGWGMSRATVLKGIARLGALGWWRADGAGAPEESGPAVPVPAALVHDRHIGAQAKVLFGVLQLTPGFHRKTAQFAYADLGRLAGLDCRTIRGALKELAGSGWVKVEHPHQHALVRVRLLNPVAARACALLDAARRRVRRAPNRGEALMQEFLSLLIASANFIDNARPGFLLNSFSGERLEFDRFYQPGVAFEFQGDQHFEPTELSSGDEFTRQVGRDLLKLGSCVRMGITLVEVRPDDLSLAAMRQKVGSLLPLRELGEEHEPLIQYLERYSRYYLQEVKRYRLNRARADASASVGPG